MRGLVGALVAVVALAGLTWIATRFSERPADPAKTVAFRPVLAVARQQSPFHVLAPAPVPAGLRATSVDWDGVGHRRSWHVGFLTTNDQYLGLYQGNGPAAPFITASTPAGKRGPWVTVHGARWRELTNSGRGETALVRTSQGITTVVTGTVGLPMLETFVASLH